MDGISRREFARRAGVSEGAIRQAIKAGKLGAFADGSLDPNLVETWRVNGHRDAGTLADAVLRKERALARLREIEVDRELGRVCEVDRVLTEVANEYSAVRNKLLGVGAETAVRLAACNNAETCKSIVDQAVHRAMIDLAESAETRAKVLRAATTA
jgi:hypothetical protein